MDVKELSDKIQNIMAHNLSARNDGTVPKTAHLIAKGKGAAQEVRLNKKPKGAYMEKGGYMAALSSPERFQKLDDGWIRDLLLGVEWGPSSQKIMDFEEAKKFCAEKGGRLPEAHELHSLVDFSKREPAVNAEVFADMKHDDWYWTGTPVAGYSGLAWCVFYRGGNVGSLDVGSSNYVRPVRASQ